MIRFTVLTIASDMIKFTDAEYVINGPWDKITYQGPKKYSSILDAWGVCDDLNRILENKNEKSQD